MLCFASRGTKLWNETNLVTKINSNFDYALSCDPSENRPVCSWSHYCIPLKRLKVLQIFYNTKEAFNLFLKKKSFPLTFTRNILEAETSSIFFLVSASRYKTSENPLAFALLMTSSTFFLLQFITKHKTHSL